MLLGDPTTDFHLNEYLISLPISSNTAGVSLRSHVLIGRKPPHTSQVRLARLIVHLEEDSPNSSVAQQPSYQFQLVLGGVAWASTDHWHTNW